MRIVEKDNDSDVARYYEMPESRIGYELFLRGTKHFGLYRTGDRAWNWPAALRRMEDKLAQELDLPSGAHVLDAGCGIGDVADHLAEEYGLNVTGIDIRDFDLRKARERSKRRKLNSCVSFRRMSYAKLDFPAETFDGVYTMEALVHAPDAEEVLAEFYRVLKPGGHLALFEYSRAAKHTMPKRADDAFREVSEVAAMPSFERFEHGVLENLITQAGFTSVTVEDITEDMRPMFKCFAEIAEVPYAVARRLGQQDRLINAMSAVEFWRYRNYFRYNVYTARK